MKNQLEFAGTTPVDRESTQGSRRKEVRFLRLCTVGHEFVEGRPFARFPAVRACLHDSGQFIEMHGEQNGKRGSWLGVGMSLATSEFRYMTMPGTHASLNPSTCARHAISTCRENNRGNPSEEPVPGKYI